MSAYTITLIAEGAAIVALIIAMIIVSVRKRKSLRDETSAEPLQEPAVETDGSALSPDMTEPPQETVPEVSEPTEAESDSAEEEAGLPLLLGAAFSDETDEAEEEADEEDVVYGRYDKSFTAKLMQSEDRIKEYYAELANYFLSYGKVRCRMSWQNSSFYAGRKAVAKFAIRGKTLRLYLALDPQEFEQTKYAARDESAVKKYEKVPLRVKVKSGRGVKFAKELADMLAERMGLVRTESEERTVRAEDYPYDTTENLLARGLIRLKLADGGSVAEARRLVWEDFGRREQVAAEEARELLADEVAAALVEEDEEEETVLPRPKGIVNIDTLSQHYEADEVVTIASLKEKGLIGGRVNYVKALARGVLSKPLTVKLPEFSADAIKMIVLTGGKAIRLKAAKK